MAAKRSKSKKRSDTSLRLSLPIFLDEALDFDRLCAALTDAGATVYRHRDYFARGAKDYEWLPIAGANGWIILTKDEAMQHGETEKIVIKNSNARVFVLVRGNLSGQEMAEIFVLALSAIDRVVQKHAPPLIAKVYRNGSVVKTGYV